MKKILLIATGGTIASRHSGGGLSPAITAEELLGCIPGYQTFCEVDTVSPFSLDSTNVGPDQWMILTDLIERKYDYYNGFVICHGTDTMAYTAAALSYLIQNNRRPVVITGSQRPIDLEDTDARTNLLDSLRFACDDRAYGVNLVFGGQVIAGTRAKKERSKSYNAFSSINYPPIAVIQDDRLAFYIDDKFKVTSPLKVSHELDRRVFLHKLIPGETGRVLDAMRDSVDAVIIESFGVGGIPDDGEGSYFKAIRAYVEAGKQVVMATQVVNEGSDMSVYEVGRVVQQEFQLPESFDMTLEACVTKTMWALGQTRDPEAFRELFYTPVNHDLLFVPKRA